MRAPMLTVLVLLAGCARSPEPRVPAADPVASVRVESAPVTKPVASYGEVVAETRSRLHKSETVAKKGGRSAILFGRAAHEALGLARLTGDYADYAHAEQLLDAAFATENSVPPYLLRARLDYTLHRLDAAEVNLEHQAALPLDRETQRPRQRAAYELFTADLAMQRGHYDDAERGYLAAVAELESPGSLASLAYYRWRTGAFDEAERLYRRSLELLGADGGEPVAWTHLQLGLMDLERGRLDDALAHYRDGDRHFPGFWLIEEHIAEIAALQGRTDEATALYLRIIRHTGNPEFMDALAEIQRAAGDNAGADAWIARAEAAYAARMKRFPEATYGHALDHYLAFGDPADALEIALRNHELRPGAEAKIGLAKAYLAAADHDAAKQTIVAALATPVVMAELHATAAAVFRATGDAVQADEQAVRARAIDPTIGFPGEI